MYENDINVPLSKSRYQKRYNLNRFLKNNNSINYFMVTMNNSNIGFLVSKAGISIQKASDIIYNRPFDFTNIAEKITNIKGVAVSTLESIDKVAKNYCQQQHVNTYHACNAEAIECLNNITEKEILYSINGIGPKKAKNIYDHVINGGFNKNLDLGFQLRKIPLIGKANATNIVNYYSNY